MTSFWVEGIPVAKGSIRAFTNQDRVVLTSTAKGLGPWTKRIKTAAEAACTSGMIEGPVWVSMRFVIPLPKSERGRERYHFVRPDLDKLVRAVLDGLTRVAFWDDGQVAEIVARKVAANGAGVMVEVFPLGKWETGNSGVPGVRDGEGDTVHPVRDSGGVAPEGVRSEQGTRL